MPPKLVLTLEMFGLYFKGKVLQVIILDHNILEHMTTVTDLLVHKTQRNLPIEVLTIIIEYRCDKIHMISVVFQESGKQSETKWKIVTLVNILSNKVARKVIRRRSGCVKNMKNVFKFFKNPIRWPCLNHGYGVVICLLSTRQKHASNAKVEHRAGWPCHPKQLYYKCTIN